MPPLEEPKQVQSPPKQLEQKTEEQIQEPVANDNSNESGSMVEDIEMGSGCVADMHKTANPKPSQKELEMNDILNSSMLNSAKELLDIKKITVKTKT